MHYLKQNDVYHQIKSQVNQK